MSETSNVYNSDIEMIMDFVKLSIIFNDSKQSETRRLESLKLQKAILETLPVAQSNRISQTYSKMMEIYRLNRDSTAMTVLDSEIQRLHELNHDIANLKEEFTQNTDLNDQVTQVAPVAPVADIRNVKQFIDPMSAPQFNPARMQQNIHNQPQNFVTIRGVKPYQPLPPNAVRVLPPFSGPITGPMNRPFAVQAPNPIMVGTKGIVPESATIVSPVDPNQTLKITTRVVSPVPDSRSNNSTIFLRNITNDSDNTDSKPNRFVIMVGDSSHRETPRVMPIWDAYKQEILNGYQKIPIIIRQLDIREQPETVDTLKNKLNLNPITGPTIYRVDLSSGKPNVVRFANPFTLGNLREFGNFN